MRCRFVYEKMMVQIRWVSGAPMSLASMNDGLVPRTNEHICLLGRSKPCLATDVCYGREQLLAGAVCQFPNLAGSAAEIARWCMLTTVATYARLRPAYWHSGRSMCTAAHDVSSAKSQSGRSEMTPMQGHYIMVHPEQGGEAMVLSVENIFTVKSEDDGQYCFLSGFAFTRDKSNEKPGVMCYLLQTVQFVIVPLLAGTRLEGVSVMPYYFVQGEGKDKEAVVLSSHMLVAPRETVPAFEDDLARRLRERRNGLREKADAKVEEEANNAAKRAAEGQPEQAQAKVRKLNHAELQAELNKYGVSHTYSTDHEMPRRRGKPFVAAVCRDLLLCEVKKAAAAAAGASAQREIDRVQAQAAGASAGTGPGTGAGASTVASTGDGAGTGAGTAAGAGAGAGADAGAAPGAGAAAAAAAARPGAAPGAAAAAGDGAGSACGAAAARA